MKERLGYRPGTSFFHRLHPLLKAAWLVSITAGVFILGSPAPNLVMLLALLVIFPLIGYRLGEIRGLKLLVITALLIALLQIIFWREGDLVAKIGGLRITEQGLSRGVYLGARFMIVVLVSYLFVLTTSPNQLAYALMKAGLPYRFGFALVTALRMVALFEEEAMTVYRAGQVRGVSYRPRGLGDIGRKLNGFILPMLVSAMSKVDALSISMEGRCFGRHTSRTYFKVREKYRGDLWAVLGLIFYITIISYLSFLEG